MEHLNNYLQIITTLSNADVQKNWTIKYYLMADNATKGVSGYTIDLGSYSTKTEAEVAMNKLATQTGHNKFYIVESGKWTTLSNKLDGVKVNIGKLDENGAKLFKTDYEKKCAEIEEVDKVKELLDNQKNDYIQHQLNLIKMAKTDKLYDKMKMTLNDLHDRIQILSDKTMDYESKNQINDRHIQIDLLNTIKALNEDEKLMEYINRIRKTWCCIENKTKLIEYINWIRKNRCCIENREFEIRKEKAENDNSMNEKTEIDKSIIDGKTEIDKSIVDKSMVDEKTEIDKSIVDKIPKHKIVVDNVSRKLNFESEKELPKWLKSNETEIYGYIGKDSKIKYKDEIEKYLKKSNNEDKSYGYYEKLWICYTLAEYNFSNNEVIETRSEVMTKIMKEIDEMDSLYKNSLYFEKYKQNLDVLIADFFEDEKLSKTFEYLWTEKYIGESWVSSKFSFRNYLSYWKKYTLGIYYKNKGIKNSEQDPDEIIEIIEIFDHQVNNKKEPFKSNFLEYKSNIRQLMVSEMNKMEKLNNLQKTELHSLFIKLWSEKYENIHDEATTLNENKESEQNLQISDIITSSNNKDSKLNSLIASYQKDILVSYDSTVKLNFIQFTQNWIDWSILEYKDFRLSPQKNQNEIKLIIANIESIENFYSNQSLDFKEFSDYKFKVPTIIIDIFKKNNCMYYMNTFETLWVNMHPDKNFI